MKKIITLSLVFVAFLNFEFTQAQINIELTRDSRTIDTLKLKKQKKVIREREKEKLKEDIKKIDAALGDGSITQVEAEKQKRDAAKKRAQNIEDQLDIFDANADLIRRNKEDVDYYKKMDFYADSDSTKTDSTHYKPRRTQSYPVIAFGFNNTVGKGQSIDDSPYKIGGSRFFEIGYDFSTALINSGFLRINYGLRFQFNGLKPKDNQYFVDEDGQTVLEEFPYRLKKAKLKMANLVIPVHFELGPATHFYATKFKIGIGGYTGLNIGTRQKLKYRIDGHHKKETLRGHYNTNNFIYGLSAYVGYDRVSLYVKYDLNPIFKNNPIDEHNVAIGLRIGFD